MSQEQALGTTRVQVGDWTSHPGKSTVFISIPIAALPHAATTDHGATTFPNVPTTGAALPPGRLVPQVHRLAFPTDHNHPNLHQRPSRVLRFDLFLWILLGKN